jgi:ribosomal protein S18 acetylase RimI-like enzyme
MSRLQIRRFTFADAPQIMALQQAHARAFAGADVIPAVVYGGPGFDEGQNVFCAWLEDGRLAGYAPFYPTPAESAGGPRVIWAEIRVDPTLPDLESVRAALYERLIGRAQEIVASAPGHPCRLTFQYHPSETPSIAFVLAHGGHYTESVFGMSRDLSHPLADTPVPAGLEVRAWRMPTTDEQARYVTAHNECFPNAPLALADWQYFLQSPQWSVGAAITAFDGEEVAGSVAVYWDEADNRATGQAAGFTEYIFVRPPWRNRGLARCLITTALAYLCDHGLQRAQLQVLVQNTNALALYEKLGYEVAAETRLYVIEVQA